MRAAWGEKIDDHALSAYFIFPGNVPYEEVPPYCGVMDVCIAPFRKEAVERSSVKIFDYLACGKPVVATDVGETSGFFAESGAVMIVPPEDPAALWPKELIACWKMKPCVQRWGKKEEYLLPVDTAGHRSPRW